MDIESSNDTSLAAVFKALGDPTRLRIFQVIRCCASDVAIEEDGSCRPAGSMSVGEVCCRVDQAGSTISHHLKELRHSGLILTEKRGRWIFCSVNPEALEAIREFVDGKEAKCQGVAVQGRAACC